MSDIPEARKLLSEVLLYAALSDDTRRKLKRVRELLGREQHVTRAPISSVKVTPKVKDEILRLKRANPDMPEQEIALRTHVSPGRVYETLAGHLGERWKL